MKKVYYAALTLGSPQRRAQATGCFGENKK